MMTKQLTFLIVQFSETQQLLWDKALQSQKFLTIVETPDVDLEETLLQMNKNGSSLPYVLLIDVQVLGSNPYGFCRKLRVLHPELKIVLTNSTMQTIAAPLKKWAISQGAADFLPEVNMRNIAEQLVNVSRISGDYIVDLEALNAALSSISPTEEANHPLCDLILSIVNDSDYRARVKELANSISPSQYPKQFITACNQLVQPVLKEIQEESPFAVSSTFEDIVERMEAKVAQVLGAKGATKIRQYADRYPETEAFLGACRKLLIPMLGPKAVDEILAKVADSCKDNNAHQVADEAGRVLEDLFGNIGTQLVVQLLKKYPPETQMDRFLQECQAIAATIVGETNAQALFTR